MDVRQQSKAAKQQKNAVKIHLLFRVTPLLKFSIFKIHRSFLFFSNKYVRRKAMDYLN